MHAQYAGAQTKVAHEAEELCGCSYTDEVYNFIHLFSNTFIIDYCEPIDLYVIPMDTNGRARDRNRHWASGSQKRKQKKEKDEYLNSMRGSMDKFTLSSKKQKSSDGPSNQSTQQHHSNDGSDDHGPEKMASPSVLPDTVIPIDSSAATSTTKADIAAAPKVNPSMSADLSTSLPTLPETSGSTASTSNSCVETTCIATTACGSTHNTPDVAETVSVHHCDGVHTVVELSARDYTDAAKWPSVVNPSVTAYIVELGPTPVQDIDYPLNDQNRKFSKSHCFRYTANKEKILRNWLIYSQSADKVYCFACKLFSSSLQEYWYTDGTNDWKHLSEKLQSHDTSTDHLNCVNEWRNMRERLDKNNTVNQLNEKQISAEKKHWRAMFDRILAAINFLITNNLALRGSASKIDEKNNGNFLSLIETFALFDAITQEHLRRIRAKEMSDHYLGKNIQNEIIHIIATCVRDKILETIKSNKYYAIIADSTRDLAKHEQLTFVLRTVTANKNSVEVREYFLDVIRLKSTTGKNMANVLLEKLKSFGLNISDCRGQGYDNGANMRGKNEGVQAHIKRLNPLAFYTPCACHNLNLALVDMAKSSTIAFSFFGKLQNLYNLFSASTQRWEILQKHVDITLKPLSDTRWESRIESIKPLRLEFDKVLSALVELKSELLKTNTADAAGAFSDAESSIKKLQKFEFVLQVVIWYDLLNVVNKTSKLLQSRNMSLDVCTMMLQKLINYFEEFRDNGYKKSLKIAREISNKHNIDPEFEKKRRIIVPRHFDYESRDAPPVNEGPDETFLREFFYVLIDTALMSFKERLSQFQEFSNIFGFLYNTTSLKSLSETDLEKHCSDLDLTLRCGDDRDLDGAELFDELKFLRTTVPDGYSLIEFLKYALKFDAYPNICIALRIALTITITVASGERSFSVLKIVENYLRTTMTQQRLSDLLLASIESDMVLSIDYDNVRETFANKKARKIDFT